jgi:hypothetical protein
MFDRNFSKALVPVSVREIMGYGEPGKDAYLEGDDAEMLGASRRRGAQATHELIFPLNASSAIAAGGTVSETVSNVVQEHAFRPERLVVADTTSQGYLINNLFVGAQFMFIAQGALSAAMFAANAVGVRLKMAVARAGITISASVTNNNTGTATSTFYSSLLGPVVRG